MMSLRVPHESRFVRAFALAVDPGDVLSLLMQIGAVVSSDMAILRHTREMLALACDRDSELKDWDQAHASSVLREALAQPDAAGYLAWFVRGSRYSTSSAEYAEALAVVGCASDTLGCRRRPWEILPDALSLPEWRQRVAKLLSALPCSSATATGENVPWCSPHGYEAGS